MQATQRQHLGEVFRRLAEGDRSVLDEAYRLLWPAVNSFCQKMLIGNPNTDDVAQEALLRVFSKIHEFDFKRDALTWVLAITAWECRSERKRVQRRASDSFNETRHATTGDDAELALFEKEAHSAMQELLGQLSERDREVLKLVSEGQPLDARLRKQKQRVIERLRGMWRTLYGRMPHED